MGVKGVQEKGVLQGERILGSFLPEKGREGDGEQDSTVGCGFEGCTVGKGKLRGSQEFLRDGEQAASCEGK